MGIKNLFNRDADTKIVSLTNKAEASENIESTNYYSAKVKQKGRFEPHVDYSNPLFFSKFGSAEKYYHDAITNIYTYYPFDGSLYERTAWELSASGIQKYIFEEEYPRRNGYIDFSYGGWGSTSLSTGSYALPTDAEYITVYGGPNKDPEGNGKSLASIFINSSSNFYNVSHNRESNLEFATAGNAIEFWMKKDGFVTPGQQEVIFDLWSSGSAVASADYGRFCILINSSSSPLHVTYLSGTTGLSASFSGTSAPTTASLADGQWHHYAVSADSSTGKAELYVDGVYKDYILGAPINEVTGALVANIGSYYEARSADTLEAFTGSQVPGWCKLSASLDEFRFWKTTRNDKNIGQYWFTQVGGGTNEDNANTDLGVYYKFNEGITQTASIDSRVLDYSGRFSDGSWTGYSAGSRNTGSAMVIAGAAEREFKDPIIYSFHPAVVSLLSDKKSIGKQYDYTNAASLYYSLPSWIIDEDHDVGGDLLNVVQIVSNYFDSLYLQTKELPKLKNVQYLSSSEKPYPFTNKSLESLGFATPDLFLESDILEAIGSRNDTEEFDEKIWNVKNLIYQNIYNNLVYIYKTKGTMKSFRNLLRCYGIDEELVRVNLYVDGATYEMRDDYKLQALEKKFVNFASTDRFNGTVYQTASSDIDDSRTYIAGSSHIASSSWTWESQVVVPSKFPISSDLYFETGFISASLFGQHQAVSDQADYTWHTDDNNNFQVYLVKEEKESLNAKFVLKSLSNNSPLPTLESPIYTDIYDNTNWNIAVRIKPQYELYNTSSATLTSSYILEFQGVETEGDYIRNEFIFSASLDATSGSNFVKNNKRVYVGAHYTNFTGTILEQTDVKITNNRVWASFLPSDVIRIHAKDSTNYGTKYPYRNAYPENSDISAKSIPAIETLALFWGYDTLSSSDDGTGSGYTAGFNVDDISSGSADPYKNYGFLNDALKTQHPGRGNKFLANDTDVIQKEYLSNAKLQSIETVQSDDLVEIISESDEEIFTRASRPLEYVYAIEKGMQQVISDEMIDVFGSIADFNNIIGQPVNRYRQDYHDMGKLRQIFFSRVKNIPSLIKYVEFYKWIDGAITSMIQQLIPATAQFSDRVATVVESHILERNKYWNKFPTVELEEDPPNSPLKGVNELLYPWKTGTPPLNTSQSRNCYWWKNRAEFHGSLRASIISASHSTFDREFGSPLRFDAPSVEKTSGGVIRLDITRQTTKFGSNGYLLVSTSSFSQSDCLDD
jgi:hypothetical protein